MESNQIKVLAIDDNPDNLTSIKALINEAFPTTMVLTAQSGEQGITTARLEDPDVILLDVVMPDMDGFAVCLAFKADEALRNIPVVFVTALKGDKENRIRALEAGGEGFLNKPIDESELAAQIRAMVKIKAAHVQKQNTTEHLEALVAKRTRELQKELEDRKKAEEELLKSQQRYQLLFNSSNDAVFVHKLLQGKRSKYTDLNDIACTQLEYSREELLNMGPQDIGPEEMDEARRSALKKLVDTGHAIFEMINITKSGKRFPVEISSRVFMDDNEKWILSVARDITERKQAEENMRSIEARLRQSEKMEAIGTLAGGIAHDFNNVLGGIIGYTDMSLDLVEKDSVIDKNLRKVLVAADRAKHLVQQILTFSRQSNQHKVVTALRPIVKEVIELLTASIPSSVSIDFNLQKDTKPVLADPTKIHEMLLNLATNAVYAMDRKGTLFVRLQSVTLENEQYGRVGKIVPGEYAVIEIADTGCGMDAQTIQKAFEPFYTTKPVGQGTGMGLSVVLGVVQLHGGDLQVESTLGKGTTFKIFLPVTHEFELEGTIAKTSNSPGGIEQILFVDDEKTLVEVAGDMLGKIGYKVIGISDSLQALQYLKEHSAEIDILVTDQTMPGLSGIELAKAALEIKNNLPVVLCTGFSSEVTTENIASMGIRQLIMKPYGAHEIRSVIREVLDNHKLS